MALLNLLEAQRNEVYAMLERTDASLSSTGTFNRLSDTGGQEWKVLIYDRRGQRILSTLVKVGSLRLRGITLHLGLHSDNRAGVPEVPAIYFCEPNEENLARILQDLATVTTSSSAQASPMYLGYRFNFISPIDTSSLHAMASVATQSGTAQLVDSVMDRYLDFISISPTEFELGIKDTFRILHGRTNDETIEDNMNAIVSGLLSVCLTLKVMPVLRCTNNSQYPSKAVATLLAKALKKAYDQGIFKGNAPKGHSSITHRPCLMILDRDVDLTAPLEHAWSYRGLVKDLLVMDANRISFEQTSSTGQVTTFAHDLDHNDTYWEQWMEMPFPELLTSVNSAVEAYDEQMKTFAARKSMEVDALSAALSSLPVLTEKKRLLDLHTNLNTVLLDKVTARKIDEFVSLEEGLFSGTLPLQAATRTLIDFYEREVGEIKDRRRALMAICASRLLKSDKQKLVQELKPHIIKDDPNSFRVLEWLISNSDKSSSLFSHGKTPVAGSFGGVIAEAEKAVMYQTEDLWQGKLGKIGKGLLDHGKGFVMQGMKAVMGHQRVTPLCTIVEEFMFDNCSSGTLTLDPLQVTRDEDIIPLTNINGTFSQGIVFIVGEGNYVESQILRTHLAKTSQGTAGANESYGAASPLSVGGNILYGCTSFDSPTEFCELIEKTILEN
eukprot:GHVH01008463.1.p1 GENE.GHVH01008463.1~~GHVH01008463.1.p1  ORF type:complete len:667 (-),score=94.18 GHVH01008463.1:80-2080(-)